ncbi:GxxExxY protein [Prosthecobacter fusiformis]|uniref:GxxExxY protein n=1 Tax=Prosthecobacter fusiformis TaxID=48464 RepID=A0A4R7SSK2_9BACT|nr:GxxExxY protein [Prosthecobacter fusiformis]TDU81168.1 GxxExxY protein [Prosthecobacter fusiformis]
MLIEPTLQENDLATQIIGCAMIVHRHFGPGLIESVYETCLCHELAKAGMKVLRQKRQPIVYNDIIFDDPFRLDVFVNDVIIIENKVVDAVLPLHKAQLRSYLKLANRRLGLLINFNVERLKDGVHRVVNGSATYDV